METSLIMKMRIPTVVLARRILAGMLLVPGGVAAQQAPQGRITVSGVVLHNPKMNDCLKESCQSDVALTRDDDWVAPRGAVNVVVRGTDLVARTDRQGRYRIEVPSADAELVFHWVGFERQVVPVEGRSTIDVRLTPTPLPVIERLLALIVPQLEIGVYPKLDDLATQAQTNRETARDIVWLVVGNRVMMREYPGEFFPDYRFADSDRAP